MNNINLDTLLTEALRLMQNEIENVNAEDAHIQADSILVEVVKLLAEFHPEQQDVLTKILTAYFSVDKRYATYSD